MAVTKASVKKANLFKYSQSCI